MTIRDKGFGWLPKLATNTWDERHYLVWSKLIKSMNWLNLLNSKWCIIHWRTAFMNHFNRLWVEMFCYEDPNNTDRPNWRKNKALIIFHRSSMSISWALQTHLQISQGWTETKLGTMRKNTFHTFFMWQTFRYFHKKRQRKGLNKGTFICLYLIHKARFIYFSFKGLETMTVSRHKITTAAYRQKNFQEVSLFR